MSTINYTYNVIVDRFRQFAAGHFQLRRFTHGEISQADLEKEAEWPWLHVKPRAINYSPGTRSFSFEIFISDLPRDKEDKTGYQAESITDCSLIFQDLINEIYLGNMFGSNVELTRPVNAEPFVEQYTHTLTGVTGTIELNLDYDWSACSIPASWNYNTPTDSPSDGWGALQFIESLDQNGVFVSLLNDVEAPGNSYYYGTNASGVKGWYAIVDNVGLTCETLPDCATIISIVDDIAALESNKVDKVAGKGLSTEDYTTAEKSKLAGIQAGAEVNVNADWNAVSGDAQILNKPTIPSIAGLVPETRTLTINGTTQDLSADRTFNVGTFNLPSLTNGSVLFSNGTTIAQDNANLFWDDTNNRLGIGTATPATTLQIAGTTTTQNILVQTGATYDIGVSATRFRDGWFSRNVQCGSVWANNVGFASTNLTIYNTSAAIVGTFFGTGNLLLSTGTQTDAGFKLDVNGTARLSDTLSFTNNSSLSPQGTTAADRRLLIRGGDGGAVGSTSLITLTTNGNITSTSGNPVLVNISRDFAPTSGTATYTLASITGVINQTGGANGITRGLYINPTLTSAADFRAIETTVGNVMLNTTSGNTLIGTTTNAGYRLDVNGSVRTTGSISAVSAIARGTYLNQTLVATANNDVLVGLDIAPTFTAGAFTGLTNLGIRSSGYIAVNPAGGLYGGFVVNSQRNADSSYNHSFVSHSPNSGVANKIYAGTRPATPTTTGVEHYLGIDNQIYWNTVNASYTFLVSGTQYFRLNNVGQVLIQNGGTFTDVASSRLTINSTTQGFLPPRMTTTQKNAIATPAAGLVVYDTTLNKLCVYTTAWETITSV